jgi:hypothetical protein
MAKWTVWVGGVEVNDYYLGSREVAESVASVWRGKGYDDVAVEEVA